MSCTAICSAKNLVPVLESNAFDMPSSLGDATGEFVGESAENEITSDHCTLEPNWSYKYNSENCGFAQSCPPGLYTLVICHFKY